MKNLVPDEIWTQHVAILAKTGRGKTVVAKGGAGRLMKQRLRCGVVDPTAAWWGMRLKADGNAKAFDMVIFGGDHGDIPISPLQGEKIGALVAGADWSWVLDISKLGADARAQFMTGFAEALFSENRRRLNLFLDECHLYMPQQKLPTRASAHMTAACNNLVGGGRSRGLNVTMISQRSAKVHKDSLTQAETLITLGMIAPHDIAAAEAWVKVQGDMKAAKAMLESLPALPVGTGWIYAPEMGMLEKVKFPMIDTFDSSRAPGVGDDLRAPAELGQINLEEIRAKLAPSGRKSPPVKNSSIPSNEAAKNNVPSQAAQERALAAARAEGAEAVRLGIPAMLDAQHAASFQMGLDWARGAAISAARGIPNPETPPARPPVKGTVQMPSRRESQSTRFSESAAQVTRFPENGLSKAERAILGVLAHFPDTGADRAKVALMAGYSARSGSFANTLSTLRTSGLMAPGDPLRPTAAGVAAAGDIDPLPAGGALLAYWCGHRALGKAEQAILRAVVNAGPGPISREMVSAVTGYSAESGSFANSLSRLRTLGLISGSRDLTAAQEFA
jgi:uncharacterized protein